MTIFGLDQGYYMSEHLALHYFQDYLLYSFDKTVLVLMKIQMKVVKQASPRLFMKIKEYEDNPVFSISWYLTWFAHCFKSFEKVARIFDFLVSTPPYMIVYLSAAVILNYFYLILGYNVA
jgi:hypothetical protein